MNFIKNNSTKIAYLSVSLFAIVYAFRFGFIFGALSGAEGILLPLLLCLSFFAGYGLLNQYFRKLSKGENKAKLLTIASIILVIANGISLVDILLSFNMYPGGIGLAIFDFVFILGQIAVFVLIIFNKMNGNAMLGILKLALLAVTFLAVIVGIYVLINLIGGLKYIEPAYKLINIVNTLPTILGALLYGGLFVFYSYSTEA